MDDPLVISKTGATEKKSKFWNLLFLQKQAKKSCFHTKKSENKIMKLAKSVIEFHKKSENGKKNENGVELSKIRI